MYIINTAVIFNDFLNYAMNIINNTVYRINQYQIMLFQRTFNLVEIC